MNTKHNSKEVVDCLIIGAGPAGISAALYLHRFRRTFILVDYGESRLLKILKSHNYPAFKNGISGSHLLKLLKDQLVFYDIPIIKEKITSLKKTYGLFEANHHLSSKTVILATGVNDITLPLPLLKRSKLIRYCPVCDAYEVINKHIALIGHESHSLAEALFLCRYSDAITIFTQGKRNFSDNELSKVKEAGIKIIAEPIIGADILGDKMKLHCSNQKATVFDALYCALGYQKNNQLALQLGAQLKEGELIVDEFQQTSVEGLYAAGDIVSGLNQICVAQGQAAVAASAINKLL